MPENTADFDIPKPLDTDKPPSLENSVGPGFDRIDELFGEIRPAQLAVPAGVGDAGKFIVVDGTGAAAYKAMTGDVSLGPTGATQIGNNKIVTAMLQNLSVTGAKVDNATLADGKLVSPNNSMRKVLAAIDSPFGGVASGSTYFFSTSGVPKSGAALNVNTPKSIRLVPAASSSPPLRPS